MSEVLKTGLSSLAVGLIFAGIFAFNMNTDEAHLRVINANRRTNPFKFWLIQGIIGAIALLAAIGGAFTLLGLLPP